MARNKKNARSSSRGLFARTKKTGRRRKGRRLSAYVSQEHDWQTEVPNLRLSRAFGFVLVLHVVAVGGILAYEMLKKDRPSPRVMVPETVEGSDVEGVAPLGGGGGAAEGPLSRGSTGAGEDTAAGRRPAPVVARQGGRPPTAVPPVASDRPRGSSAGDSAHMSSVGDDPPAEAPPVGTVLRALPYKPEGEQASVSPAPPSPEPPSAGPPVRGRISFIEYTVVKGDTLYGLGRRHGVVPEAIRQANGLEDDGIRVGQVIRIPRRME